MNERVVVILLFLVGVVGFTNQIQAADIYISDNSWCGATLNSTGDTYILTTDLTCSGDGLIVGAHNITIDGNGYTITGDGEGGGDFGIDNFSSYDNITIKNLAITNFGRGVYLNSCTGSTVQNVTAASNEYGIYLNSSFSNELKDNIMSENQANLYVDGNNASEYDNDIDTSNTVEGKPVYYFYDNDGTEEIPLVYDGNIIGDIGMFWCISCDYVQVKNATLSANNYQGVYFNNTTNSTIQNITANSNLRHGIYLEGSSSNNLNNNTANSNGYYGVYLYSSSSDNNLTGNTANSNSRYGIYLSSSSSNNNLNNNTTNLNFDHGICLSSSSSNTLTSNTANSNCNSNGIYLSSSSSNTLTGNTANSNRYGIYLSSSSSNTLTGNTANLNCNYGIYLSSSSSTEPLTGNILFGNKNDIYDNGTNTYSDNQFLYAVNNSKMLTFEEVTRAKSVNDTISFNVSAFNLDGSDCNGCTAITTSPSETVTIDSELGNDITGHFTVTRPGIYSLIFTITDSDGNVTKKKYIFFVDGSGSQTTRYYLRGVDPTHGQPANDFDARSLLFMSPADTDEDIRCSSWVQLSPDEIPDFPLAILSSVDTNTWYITQDTSWIGIQKFVSYSTGVSYQSDDLPASPGEHTNPDNYTWINVNLADLNWTMEYPHRWYWLALKLEDDGFGVFGQYSVIWRSTPEYPSYADFTYTYTTTPAVKSISNTDITLLSATEPVDDEDNATIVLDGTGSTSIVLDDYNRPFFGYATTINSDGTATLQATGLTGETTINSVNMDVIPSSGLVDILVTAWSVTGNHHREWIETASAPGITAEHTVGDLALNDGYFVVKNGVLLGLYSSDSSGRITFTCPAGSVFYISRDVSILSQIGSGGGTEGEKWCLIATAAYGTPMVEEVKLLRWFRDKYLLTNPVGAIFVDMYYKVSPPVAGFIERHPFVRKTVRGVLKPIVWMSRNIIE